MPEDECSAVEVVGSAAAGSVSEGEAVGRTGAAGLGEGARAGPAHDFTAVTSIYNAQLPGPAEVVGATATGLVSEMRYAATLVPPDWVKVPVP